MYSIKVYIWTLSYYPHGSREGLQSFWDSVSASKKITLKYLQAYLKDIEGSVPDHHNTANIAVKWVTQIFCFPVHLKFCLHDTVVY